MARLAGVGYALPDAVGARHGRGRRRCLEEGAGDMAMDGSADKRDDAAAASAEADHGDPLAQLVLCHTALSPAQARLLHKVFPVIVARHGDMVRGRIRRWALTDAAAEDLFQESFLALWEDLLAHGFPDRLEARLRTITVRKLCHHLRDAKRSPETLGVPSSGSAPPATPPDLNRALDYAAVVREILPRLSRKHRAVLEAAIGDELTHQEAAIALDLPLGTVKSELMAAKRAFAALAVALLPPSERPR
jgi:RNA polymerase sigma-70 factor (ECF subfamily)